MLYLVRSDHIGRPVFATNTLGIKVWEASYLPFGGVHTSTGSPINLRFPGQWFQSEAGLHQNWMRDYDPTTGRYVQGDPLGLVDGPSVYGYVRQSPFKYIDPMGLEGEGVGNDPGFSDPNVARELRQRLNDPSLSQKEKSKIRKRLREIERQKSKIDNNSDRRSKKTKTRGPGGPRGTGGLPIPSWIFNPCNYNPMLNCISYDPDDPGPVGRCADGYGDGFDPKRVGPSL